GDEPVNYRIRYRPRTNDRDGTWYETVTPEQWKAIISLQPDTEYEVQVRAEQPGQQSEYTSTRIFRTQQQQQNTFVCKEDVPPLPLPDNSTPTFYLSINDTINAGGFKILVREIKPGTPGTWTGAGMAIVPY